MDVVQIPFSKNVLQVLPMLHRNPLSRRNFLRGTAAGAVVGATAASVLARGVAANDEVRLAFLSCGGRANELMGSFEKISSVKVVGV